MNARRHHRRSTAAVALALAMLAGGCSGSSSGRGGSEATSATEATGSTAAGAVTLEQAREAGAIAREIVAAPERLDAILEAHGTTAERFDALLIDIAADPRLAAAYEEARAATAP